MVDYDVTVYTGNLAYAGTWNQVSIKLVGKDGESQDTPLNSSRKRKYLCSDTMSHSKVYCPKSIGRLELIELTARRYILFISDDWYPTMVVVTSPEGETYNFPIYHWITDSVEHNFREGTALLKFNDTHDQYRVTEIRQRREDYRWCVHKDIPSCIQAENIFQLPPDERFSFTKTAEMGFTVVHGLMELGLEEWAHWLTQWKDVDDIAYLGVGKLSATAEYVREHWKEDAFFGYQLLNGVNPMLCSKGTQREHVTLLPVTSPPQLLIPHTRYTLEINVLARELLISENGVFAEFTASGADGARTIVKNATSAITYTSLCLPDDITERGLKDLSHFYYRDDGLKLWDIIHGFVDRMLTYYYETDEDVQKDSELQDWISDIFEKGFQSQSATGIPQSFSTVDDLVKFVTMVIFTCSAQHSAVNSGQYEYGSWMPNLPSTMQLPPTTKKGRANKARMLKTLPDVKTTVHIMSTLWLLSKRSTDSVFLGQYPEKHFTEQTPRNFIKDFQGKLGELSAAIKARNNRLEVPYTYLDPELIENSVSL